MAEEAILMKQAWIMSPFVINCGQFLKILYNINFKNCAKDGIIVAYLAVVFIPSASVYVPKYKYDGVHPRGNTPLDLNQTLSYLVIFTQTRAKVSSSCQIF